MTPPYEAGMRETELRKKAKALVDSVRNDDGGQLIAGQWVGGNGGLLSRETIKAADALDVELLKVGKAE